MKTNKKILFSLFFVLLISLLFSSSVTAVSYLNENSTWQQNLTAIDFASSIIGDIDNDGDLDLILNGKNSDGNSIAKVYENNGTSFDENTTWQQNLTNINRGSMAFGDIDNDGDLDLALTGCSSGGGTSACDDGGYKSYIYENNGTSFHENTTWSQNLTGVFFGTVAFGDIDNDGDLDLVLCGSSLNEKISKIYLNNGTSLVESTQWQQNLTAIDESGLALGDIDNDEDLDLVLSGEASSKISKIYLNNGTSLVESTQWQQNLLAVDKSSVVLGDFDNDLDLDLSLIGCCDHHYTYLNNGTSLVENQTDIAKMEDETFVGVFDGSQALGDYDNDGDLDLMTTGREYYTTLYLYNSSAQSFTNYNQNPESDIPNIGRSSLTWADFDNDSDLDLALTGIDRISDFYFKVYTNNITTSNTQPTSPIQFTNYTTVSGEIHLGWGNGSDNETSSNGLYYNLRLGTSSAGNQIISGKYGGGEDNGYFGNMMQRKNITLKSTRLSTNTKYFWSVQVIDTGLKTSSWSTEQSFNTSGDLTTPTPASITPINYYNTSNPVITFNITAYDNRNLTNITLYGNWTGSWHANETNSSGINDTSYLFTVNLTNDGDGFYKWSARACDNSSLCKFSSNRTFSIDTHYPNISLILPSNSSTWTTSSTVTFQYNVTDLHISNCSLIIDSTIQETDYSIITDTTQIFTKSLSNGNYNWNINCTDEVNYQNTSLINKLTVSYSTGGGISTRSGIRAYTKPIVPEKKVEEKPVKKIPIKEEHLKEIKLPEKEPIKEKVVSFFETILAFLISLFIISSYIWIIKEDFRK